jgi:hypothetical protein
MGAFNVNVSMHSRWSMDGGSLPGGGIGTYSYSYVTLVQWNIFDEKPIFCDDLSLPLIKVGWYFVAERNSLLVR